MTQVVNPRLLSCVCPLDTCAIAYNSEVICERHPGDGAALHGCEKESIGWPSLRTSTVVLNQGPVQLWSDGNQSRFAELRIPNRQDRVVQVHVGASQIYCFTPAQARPVVHQNHRAERRRLQGGIPRMRFDHLEKTTEFLSRIDVGNE